MPGADDNTLLFATLGPAGSNHDWVARRYLAFHGLHHARVVLFDDFDQAFQALLRGGAAHLIQAAVHPSVTDSVARHHGRAHLIDTFLSASQPMAVLTRAEVAAPSSLGLQPATRSYVDVSRWATLFPEPSTVHVARGLLAGRYDSGITLARFATEHPGRLRVEQTIGAVVDPWLVYGREPTCTNGLQAWPDSPAALLFRHSR